MAFKMKGPLLMKMVKNSAVKNLGFIKAKTLEKNPNAKTMNVDGKEMPIKMKKAPAKMAKDPAMKMKKAPTKMKKAPMRKDRPTSYLRGEEGYIPDSLQNLFRSDKNKIKRPKVNTETGEPVKPKPTPRPKVKTINKIEPRKVGKINTTKKSEGPKKVAVQTKAEKERAKVEKTNKTMRGKTQLKDTKLGKVKIGKGKDAKNLSDTKLGKAFSKGRAKAAESRARRKAIFDAAKAERKAKRDAKKNKK